MKQIAIVICNYNGGMDTVHCIEAVMKNTWKDIDIYVVDNASEDNSVALIENSFGDKVTILHNEENLGGSGGFGRGMRHAVDQGYEYVMLLDNDAFIDTDTIEKLYVYIRAHKEIGIVGAKIMTLNDRERIFDFAKMMQWDKFYDGSEWYGRMDSPETQKPFECDYVAATTAIARREAIIASGGMDEAHFIYYDDIEMCQRIRMSGYKVVCLGTAKAWHRSSLSQRRTNTFAEYYMTRNRYRFYGKYLPEERLEEFADYIIAQAFPYMYGSHYMGREDVYLSNKYIIEDFMNDVRGKARPGRIQTIKSNYKENIAKLIRGKKKIGYYIKETGSEGTARRFVHLVEEIDPEVAIENISKEDAAAYDMVVCFCGHVKDESENILPAVYIDMHNNIVDDWNAYLYFQNYDNAYSFFSHIYKPAILEGIARIREKV